MDFGYCHSTIKTKKKLDFVLYCAHLFVPLQPHLENPKHSGNVKVL